MITHKEKLREYIPPVVPPTAPTEIVKDIMASKHITMNDMAEAFGMTQNAMRNRLRLNNISIDKLEEMLTGLGYKILIVPSETKLRNREYEVVPDQE